MKTAGSFFVFITLCLAKNVGVMAASQPGVARKSTTVPRVIDVDFAAGAIAAAWKADGSEIATQGVEGVAIRDASTLRLKRFFSAKTTGVNYSDYFHSPLLVAWSGNNLVFEERDPDYNGGSVPGSALFVPARRGGPVVRQKGAKISPDHQTLFYSNGKGCFRVLSFAFQRWFNITLPLREYKSKPVHIDPNFPKDFEFWGAQITFSPDGRYAADQVGDGRMRLWDIKTASVITTLRDKVYSLAYPAVTGPVVWSPDGRLVATLGEDPTHRDVYFEEGPNDGSINQHTPVVKIWNAWNGKLLQWFGATKYDESDKIHLRWLDNDRLFVGAKDAFQVRSVRRKAKVLAPRSSDEVKVYAPYVVAPNRSRVFARNRLFAFIKRPGWIGQSIHSAPIDIENLAWSRDGQFLAASFDNTETGGVQVWRRVSHDGRFALANVGLSHSPMRIGWTQSNRVWSSDFYAITFWNGRKSWQEEVWKAPFIGKRVFDSAPPANGLFALADDKTRLVLPDSGDALYRWTEGNKTPQLLFDKAQSGGFSEVLSPDDRFLCFWTSIGNDTLGLKLFDLKVRGRSLQLAHPSIKDAEGNSLWELSPVFSRDGKRLAWGTKIWQMPEGKPVGSRQRREDGGALALNRDGTQVLRGGPEGLGFFEPLSGKRIRRLAADADGIGIGAWSPDNRFVALPRRNVIEVYDVKRNALVNTLYAWPVVPKSVASKGRTSKKVTAQWLSLAPGGKISGSVKAKNLVRAVR